MDATYDTRASTGSGSGELSLRRPEKDTTYGTSDPTNGDTAQGTDPNTPAGDPVYYYIESEAGNNPSVNHEGAAPVVPEATAQVRFSPMGLKCSCGPQY